MKKQGGRNQIYGHNGDILTYWIWIENVSSMCVCTCVGPPGGAFTPPPARPEDALM